MSSEKETSPSPAVAVAKDNLRNALVKFKGDTSHPDVKVAIDHLASVAASEREDGTKWAPTQDMSFNSGTWKMISAPNFPKRLEDDDSVEDPLRRSRFTLGRMSFGMYKPSDAVGRVDQMINIIEPLDKVSMDPEFLNVETGPVDWKQSYNVEVELDITPVGSTTALPAKMTNYAVCFPKTETRLGVMFTGGKLEPRFTESNEPDLYDLWKKTFKDVIAKDVAQQSMLSRMANYTKEMLMSWMLQLEVPSDREDLSQVFKMGRPPVGFLDILFFDESMRITKGNRGTIVIVERI